MAYRSRSRGSQTLGPGLVQNVKEFSCSDGTAFYYNQTFSSPYPALGAVKTTEDYVTENYHQRRKKGEWIMNNFHTKDDARSHSGSSYITMVQLTPSFYCSGGVVRHSGYEYLGSYNLQQVNSWPLVRDPLPDILSTVHKTQIENETWTKCLAGRQAGNANFFESLAEADQAYHMLGNPLENLRHFTDNFHRGVPKGKKRGWGSGVTAGWQFASSEWLRYRYGIRPIISDVQAALKALKTQYNANRVRVHRTSASGGEDAINAGTTFWNNGALLCVLTDSRTHRFSVRAHYYDRYRRTVFDDLGITFHNAVALPWELTRLSFVVDWFGNVGDVIYANIPRVGIEPLGGCLTTREEKDLHLVPISTTSQLGAGWLVTGSVSDSVHRKVVETTRKSGPGTTRLALRSWLSHGQATPNYNRVVDAFALASQAFARISFGKW